MQYTDSHIHAYAPFDKGMKGLHQMKEMSVTDANLLAYTYIETGIDNNLVCLYYKEKCKDVRLRVFGGLYYDRDINNKTLPYKEQAELLLAMGCDGIKFLDMKPNYQLYCGITCDDPIYDELYDYLEEKGVPTVTHVADPGNFWDDTDVSDYRRKMGWCYSDPKFLTRYQIYDCLLRRLDKNPTLNFSIAHFGFMSDDLVLAKHILDTYPNVTFDLTPGWEIFVDFAKDFAPWKEFFEEYSTRILYGTDTDPAGDPKRIEALQRTIINFVSKGEKEFPIPVKPDCNMRGLSLSDSAKKNILHDNYFRFVGTDIKPLDKALFLEHSKHISSIAEKNHDASMLATLREMAETI